LLLHRAPRDGAYWHVVAGHIERGETAIQAAQRELHEETGLTTELSSGTQTVEYADRMTGAPAQLLAQCDPSVLAVPVECFRGDAPDDWEPMLNDEHDDHRWCSPLEACNALRWPATAQELQRMLVAAKTAGS
jgi:8-oxo-dGTP pyrophosphatase MutT (NUDIX family)